MRQCLSFSRSLTVVAVLLAGGAMSMGDDTVDEQAAREQELKELKELYVRVSGREPAPENLLASIEIRDAKGEKATEVIAALNLMAMANEPDPALALKIRACYDGNPGNWTVRSTCVRAMLHVKRPEGLGLARTVLADPKANLETRLLTATYMVQVGELEGYPIVSEGLRSEKVIEERLARDLVELFRKYDGVEIPAIGQTVDVERLLSEVRSGD